MVDPLSGLDVDRRDLLVSWLADGRFHSGEAMAQELGISRAAISKRIHALADLGLDIYAVRGRGYCLSQPLELLDPVQILSSVSPQSREVLTRLRVFPVVDSTNRFLLRELETGPVHASAVLAEYQASGKGRRGNRWVSPFGSGICLSIGWQFDAGPASINALSLAAGVVICRCLRRFGADTAALKWPNDIISEGKKLGGILIESRSESGGRSDVITGVGINVSPGDAVLAGIEQPVTSLSRITGDCVSRNALAADMVEELVTMLRTYQARGFSAFVEEWRRYDGLQGRHGQLFLPEETLSGLIMGIDDYGMLKMSIDGETRVFGGGELSLRAQP